VLFGEPFELFEPPDELFCVASLVPVFFPVPRLVSPPHAARATIE
jgi:hypothetical protein